MTRYLSPWSIMLSMPAIFSSTPIQLIWILLYNQWLQGHSGYFEPWSYLLCFKDSKWSRASWYETSAANEIKMRQRLPRTKSGKPSLLYFDAPAMTSYQLLPKAHETVYCRKVVTPRECEDGYNGNNPKLVNPISMFEAHKMKGISQQACHGLPGTVYSPVFERTWKSFGEGCLLRREWCDHWVYVMQTIEDINCVCSIVLLISHARWRGNRSQLRLVYHT
jgi:hypothetical protein